MPPPQSPKQLAPTPAPSTRPDLAIASTVGAFASRMARKLEEQKQVNNSSAKAKETRSARILKAMTVVRKNFQEIAKIQVGDRFILDIDVSDWEGWPRIQLSLLDSELESCVVRSLTVTVCDTKAMGLVRFVLNSNRVVAEIALTEESELEKLTPLLQRSGREFLDEVSSHILNPEASQRNTNGASDVEGLAADLISRQLAKEDLFTDESGESDNVVDHLGANATPLDEV